MRCVCEVVFYWSALLAVGFETAVHLNTIDENRTNLPNGLTSLYEFSDKVMYLIIIATRSLTVTFFFTCTLRHLPCVFFFGMRAVSIPLRWNALNHTASAAFILAVLCIGLSSDVFCNFCSRGSCGEV